MNILNEYKDYFSANEKPEVLEIVQGNYISILGEGSPGTAIFYTKKAAIILLTEGQIHHYNS